MKRAMLGLAVLAGAGAISSADAADIYGRGSLKDQPVAYMPAITWTGFYFGAHAGAALFDEDGRKRGKNECYQPEAPAVTEESAVSAQALSNNCGPQVELLDDDEGYSRKRGSGGLDDTSWLAGLHLGYNWQRSNGVVLGLEGDVSFADDIDYLASIRARLGFAHGATLLYATGGAAFIGFDDAFGDDDSSTGWVAGLGVEHKLRDSVSIGLEGLYYAFDDLEGYDDELDFWTVRARLTYHFTDSRSDPLK